jgi:CO/xanthine dehydrogenase FAD-binding subunit
LADSRIRLLVDLSEVVGLSHIERRENQLHIGSMVTLARLQHDEVVSESAPLLARAAAQIGDDVLRNQATIGGNLATTERVTDLPVVLMALNASLVVASASGRRSVSSQSLAQDDFFLSPSELIVEIVLPVQDCRYWSYRKQSTNVRGVSIASLAVVVPRAGDPVMVAGTGLRRPQRLSASAASGPMLPPEQLASRLTASLAVSDDLLASADYRRHVIRVLLAAELARMADRGGA